MAANKQVVDQNGVQGPWATDAGGKVAKDQPAAAPPPAPAAVPPPAAASDALTQAQAAAEAAQRHYNDLYQTWLTASDDLKIPLGKQLETAQQRLTEANRALTQASAAAGKSGLVQANTDRADASADWFGARAAAERTTAKFMQDHGGKTPAEVQAEALRAVSVLKDAGVLSLDQAKAVVAANHTALQNKLAAYQIGQNQYATDAGIYGHDVAAQTAMRNADESTAASLASMGTSAGLKALEGLVPSGYNAQMDEYRAATAAGRPARQIPQGRLTSDDAQAFVSRIADMAVRKALDLLGAQNGQTLGQAATAGTGFTVMDRPMPVFSRDELKGLAASANQQPTIAPLSPAQQAAIQTASDPAALQAASDAAISRTLTPPSVGAPNAQ